MGTQALTSSALVSKFKAPFLVRWEVFKLKNWVGEGMTNASGVVEAGVLDSVVLSRDMAGVIEAVSSQGPNHPSTQNNQKRVLSPPLGHQQKTKRQALATRNS